MIGGNVIKRVVLGTARVQTLAQLNDKRATTDPKENAEIEFCMNCDRVQCPGSCSKIVAFHKKLKKGNKQ